MLMWECTEYYEPVHPIRELHSIPGLLFAGYIRFAICYSRAIFDLRAISDPRPAIRELYSIRELYPIRDLLFASYIRFAICYSRAIFDSRSAIRRLYLIREPSQYDSFIRD
ncbi:hypothetical protein AB6A40_008151 [Gnathostoma spinigerum]|uniref:Uncharacterized protein n=1 Tax=Gnathostoma spinigerum TaxID=75299 RepID=A0ABD6EXW2_9BILA